MPEQSQIANRKSQILAWQGWSLAIPATWNPVKIDGDHDQGSMLLADLNAARLGLRWRTAGKDNPNKWADRALRDELGSSADHARAIALNGDDWKVARLCLTTDFPGRDVVAAWSGTSNRVIEVVYNASSRDTVLKQDILPTLTDTRRNASHRWSIFGLDFTTPAGLALQSFALNAGDLSLTFRSKRQQTTIRRISPASLALARQPLEKWLMLGKSNRKIYRSPKPSTLLSLPLRGRLGGGDERKDATERNPILKTTAPRRLRLGWAWFIPRTLHLLAAHDEPNNRLLLGTSSDIDTLQSLFAQLLSSESSTEAEQASHELAGVA